MLFGVALGGSSSAFNAGNAQGSASGIHVGAYTGFRVKGFYGTASVAYSNFANKTTRSVGAIGAVAGEQETGSFSSEEIRTRLEIGRRIASENFAVTPFTAIEIAHLHTKPFIEQAAGGVGMFALSFNGQGIASTPTFIGLKAEARLDLGGAPDAPVVPARVVGLEGCGELVRDDRRPVAPRPDHDRGHRERESEEQAGGIGTKMQRRDHGRGRQTEAEPEAADPRAGALLGVGARAKEVARRAHLRAQVERLDRRTDRETVGERRGRERVRGADGAGAQGEAHALDVVADPHVACILRWPAPPDPRSP